LLRDALSALEQASPQQQAVEEQKTPKHKGLIEPLGHWHWKWGRLVTSVITAVSQRKPAQIVLPEALIGSLSPSGPSAASPSLLYSIGATAPALQLDNAQRKMVTIHSPYISHYLFRMCGPTHSACS
jgi:hypothetical protein